MSIELIGRKIFGIGMIYLAILGIISQDFIIGRPPAIYTHPILAYILGSLVIIAAALIVLNNRKGGSASLLIAFLIFVFSFLVRHLPFLSSAASFENILWSINAYKTLAIGGGALIVAASFFEEQENQTPLFIQKYNAVKYFRIIGSLTLAAFLIISGFAHFKYADFVIDLIPSYIPFHIFWTYFCGICLIAGGIGLLIPYTRKLAALLSGIMILGWFILLHIPRLAANINDASDQMGLGESFALVGVFFVLAKIYSRHE